MQAASVSKKWQAAITNATFLKLCLIIGCPDENRVDPTWNVRSR